VATLHTTSSRANTDWFKDMNGQCGVKKGCVAASGRNFDHRFEELNFRSVKHGGAFFRLAFPAVYAFNLQPRACVGCPSRVQTGIVGSSDQP
jgi:hypothetical protein